MFACIVVGTDGSPTARQAVSEAADLAVVGETTVHLVTVYSAPVSPVHALAAAGPMTPDFAALADDHMQKTDAALRQTADDLRRKGINVEVHAAPGDPANLIIDVATSERADLIVVGNKGMTGAQRLLGSVPNKVAHHAPCNLLIVYTTPSRQDKRRVDG